jgi:molecular chaperone GrpE
MAEDTHTQTTAVEDDAFSAAAPPHPGARGTGETSFGDAEAPAAAPARGPEGEETAAAGADEPTASPEAGESAPSSDADKAAAPSRGGAGGEAKEPSDADKAAEYLALAKRTQADFDNYRKRMARENAAAADRGAGRLAKELLPALDHLDLALKAAEGHEDVIRGFAMVREELMAALGRVGIQPYAPEGEAFDPSEHEAMAQRPVEGAEPGTVIEVYQQGYRINGMVLRPARVVVAQ